MPLIMTICYTYSYRFPMPLGEFQECLRVHLVHNIKKDEILITHKEIYKIIHFPLRITKYGSDTDFKHVSLKS